jgi:hypothetical protein
MEIKGVSLKLQSDPTNSGRKPRTDSILQPIGLRTKAGIDVEKVRQLREEKDQIASVLIEEWKLRAKEDGMFDDDDYSNKRSPSKGGSPPSRRNQK